ncbi:MAG: YafY family protein [Pseudomonadota bacterium]
MRRADRLFEIVQHLRRARGPITASDLAGSLEVCERTVYRDMAALQSQGVPVDGEAGMGYVLAPGYDLPPLMFTADEIESIVLGARLVAQTGDSTLTRASEDVLAKIEAVLSAELARRMSETALFVPWPSDRERLDVTVDLAAIRRAIRDEVKIDIDYGDVEGRATSRTIRPIAIVFYEGRMVVAAWCELREDFRHFRADRIQRMELTDRRFSGHGPRFRAAWLKEVTQHERSNDCSAS